MTTPDLDAVEAAFDRRYRLKKTVNLLLSAAIVALGVSSFLFGLRLEPMPTIFRFLTVDGTLFTTFGAAAFLVVNAVELLRLTELTRQTIYFLRLSSAVAESVILLTVLVSQLPLFEEHLLLFDRYDSLVMHLLLPLLGISTFLINDSPIGRVSAARLWRGTWFVTVYVAVMAVLIGAYALPADKIPYFFMDFRQNGWAVCVLALLFVYGVGYLMSKLLCEANRRLSWLWFAGVARRA